jgi:hypothetical protein
LSDVPVGEEREETKRGRDSRRVRMWEVGQDDVDSGHTKTITERENAQRYREGERLIIENDALFDEGYTCTLPVS